MNEIFAQRPTYFEGQFLGAADLSALADYGRDQTARHALGLHTWGIGAGLDLVEVPNPAGDLDVYVLPGYAVDGYGRPVVVPSPTRLLPEPFSRLGTDAIPVWLRLDEAPLRGVRRGFEVCDAVDAFSRMGESFALEVGPRTLIERESGTIVGGDAVPDAREARRTYEANGPLVCDASVPYQQLSRGNEPSRWLIPLGLVGWQWDPLESTCRHASLSIL